MMESSMINGLRQLLREPRTASLPAGQRAYAIGDIHGQRDLFAALAAAIDVEDTARPAAETTVLLLGDLVDRGPDSAGVIEDAMRWSHERTVRLIAGNHEELFLHALDPREDPDSMRHFLSMGGVATLLSYGLPSELFEPVRISGLRVAARAAVPAAHRNYLRAGEALVRIGDYLFTHAGIRPGVPLGAQKTSDLRWIREPFLSSTVDHGVIVVHGHTIVEEPDVRSNRIGIDTGAFFSRRLTGLGLEGTQRWLIEAREDDQGTILTARRPA
jgi:serine/threonine protein phosphatase 1